MSKASKMIQAMDQLQITQKPYKAHYLTECDQKIRQQYLQLLFSVVSLEGFNDAQQRIWQLLSQSIGVDGTSSDEMNSELIQNVVQSCVENKLQYVFALDLLVLLRLNTVSDEQARILAELISLFALSNEDVDALIHLSDLILSISDKGQNLTEFKYETIRHWHEFSYQILTKELLVAGLNGGRWIQLNDITEVNKPVNINSSSLYCMGEKLISTANHPIKIKDSQFDVNLKAENCTLEILETNFANQSIELLGDKNNAFFEDCNFARAFEASYDDPTYLNCPNGYLKINRCKFQTENISTINSQGTKITVENSTFEKCGNPKGSGAVNVSDGRVDIVNCQFKDCISNKNGSALFCQKYTVELARDTKWNIQNCHFSNSIIRENKAVYFRYRTKINLGYSSGEKINQFIHNCQFVKANLLLCAGHRYSGWESTSAATIFINNSLFKESFIFKESIRPRSDSHFNSFFTHVDYQGSTFENNGKRNSIEIPQEEA